MGVADPDRLAAHGLERRRPGVNKAHHVHDRFKAASSYAAWRTDFFVRDRIRAAIATSGLAERSGRRMRYPDVLGTVAAQYVTAAHTPTIFFIGQATPVYPCAVRGNEPGRSPGRADRISTSFPMKVTPG